MVDFGAPHARGGWWLLVRWYGVVVVYTVAFSGTPRPPLPRALYAQQGTGVRWCKRRSDVRHAEDFTARVPLLSARFRSSFRVGNRQCVTHNTSGHYV